MIDRLARNALISIMSDEKDNRKTSTIMNKKTDISKPTVFSTERAKASSTPLAKLVIRKQTCVSLGETISDLMQQAHDAGIDPTMVRGTLYLY
jgi:hypothetical protein